VTPTTLLIILLVPVTLWSLALALGLERYFAPFGNLFSLSGDQSDGSDATNCGSDGGDGGGD
jgi:hypothetical protein